MLFFEERGKPEYPEKNLSKKGRTNNKLNPHMTPGLGIEPGPHWWEVSALTTASTERRRQGKETYETNYVRRASLAPAKFESYDY